MIDSNQINEYTDSAIKLADNGSFVELKNNLEVDIYFNVNTLNVIYEKYKFGVYPFIKEETKKISEKTEQSEFTLAPNEIKLIACNEYNWVANENGIEEKLNQNIDITLAGIDEKGEGDYNKNPEMEEEHTLEQFWYNWGWIITIIIILVIILLLLWKFKVFDKLAGLFN